MELSAFLQEADGIQFQSSSVGDDGWNMDGCRHEYIACRCFNPHPSEMTDGTAVMIYWPDYPDWFQSSSVGDDGWNTFAAPIRASND